MKLLNNFLKLSLRKRACYIAFTVALAIMFAALFSFNIKTSQHQQFVYLADSFLHGKLYFEEQHKPFLIYNSEEERRVVWVDTALWGGRHYWPLGPFPAVVLLPFVAAFGTQFLQGYISFFLTIVNFSILWKIAKKFSFDAMDALFLAAFFIFGSAYLGVATYSLSWYFAQVIAVTALLLALHEFFYKKRHLIIGVYLAFAVSTRSNLILAALFFILMIMFAEKAWKLKLKNFMLLMFPSLVTIVLLLVYNFARFHNIFENGYLLQDINPIFRAARNVGLFSIRHIPGNLYFLLFRGPDAVHASDSYVLHYPYIRPDIWGLSIFITSPLFLYIFRARWREKIVRAASITSLLIALPLLMYYGIGTVQFGYRYALDFYPFLYILLCKGLEPKLPLQAKILIVLGIILDWHLLLHFLAQSMPS